MITYGTGVYSWLVCMLFVREFTTTDCIDNFGAIFLHYFGYIEEDHKYDVIYRQGVLTMRKVFRMVPDWAWYDGGDMTTNNV